MGAGGHFLKLCEIYNFVGSLFGSLAETAPLRSRLGRLIVRIDRFIVRIR